MNKKIKKIRPVKNTWYDWLINCIPEPIRKNVGGLKDKVISLFKTNTPKQRVYGKEKKLSKPKAQNKIKNIRNLFILKKKKIKDRIIRDIWTLFETENEKKKERNKLEKKLMTDQLKKASLEDIGHFLSIKEKKIIINRK